MEGFADQKRAAGNIVFTFLFFDSRYLIIYLSRAFDNGLA